MLAAGTKDERSRVVARLEHVQTIWAKDYPFLKTGALLRGSETSGGYGLSAWSAATRRWGEIGLDDGRIAASDVTELPLGGVASRSMTIGGRTRKIEADLLKSLSAAPGESVAQAAFSARHDDRLALVSVETGSALRLYAASASQGGISAFRPEAGTGTLVPFSQIGDATTRYLGGIDALTSIRIDGQAHLIAVSAQENGVNLVRLDAAGRMRHVAGFGVEEELPLYRPVAVAAQTTDQGSFAVVASQGSSSLTLLQVDAAGFRFADQLIDSRDTRFDAVTGLAMTEHQGRVLIAAAGRDGGVSLFELLPLQKRLLHRDTLVDQLDTALSGVTSLRFETSGTRLELVALSQGDEGLTRLRVETGPAGLVGLGRDGGSGADLLTAGSGSTLSGGAGDDVLIDAPGRKLLRGGSGADRFVFDDDGTRDVIRDFDPEQDLVDLSLVQGLYHAGAVSMHPHSRGLLLRYGADSLVVLSADGAAIPEARMSAALTFDAHRVWMPDSAAFLVFNGTEGSDNFRGSLSDESFWGKGGADWITPGTGDDTVDGGAGSDMISFVDLPQAVRVDLDKGVATSGSDTNQITGIENVTGSVHGDAITGDDGGNRLRGLGGYDWFTASWGNDSYEGGTGRDMVSYVRAPGRVVADLGAGRGIEGMARGDLYKDIERLTGSVHADRLTGSSGEDDLRGLGGYDWFVGSGGGKDRYDGGSGLDTVAYTTSPQKIIASLALGRGSAGDAARDLYTSVENLTGSNHADKLTGDHGRNMLRGMWGEDRLYGLGGVDRLTGGGSNDVLDGGAGWDIALYAHDRDDYKVFSAKGLTSVTYLPGGGEGRDLLIDIEALQFADGLVYL